jgi:superfamily II helicase
MSEVKKKVCKICGEEKFLRLFVSHKNYKDKHSDICLDCNREKYHTSFRVKVLESLERIENKIDAKSNN